MKQDFIFFLQAVIKKLSLCYRNIKLKIFANGYSTLLGWKNFELFDPNNKFSLKLLGYLYLHLHL
jgi:hypothetical protein